MPTLDLFLALAKVDVDRRADPGRRHRGGARSRRRDLRLRFDQALFRSVVGRGAEGGGGKSLGAVRAMHGRVAAGKLTDIAFDDEGKRILVSAKIVDDEEWRKVQEGVYTGFSQGGRYVKRWPDPDTGLTRYTAEPNEISLVDLPCLPGATFEVVKDGAVEKRAFARAPTRRNRPADESRCARTADSAAAPAALASAESPPAAEVPSPSAALAKAASALALAADKLERAVAENSALRQSVGALAPEVAALVARVAALEAQPQPARAALRATPKRADAALADEPAFGVDEAIKRLAELAPEARALALTKLSLAHPQPLRF